MTYNVFSGTLIPTHFTWNDEHQKSFESVRDILCTSHVLRVPCLGKPFTLHTDASDCAVGSTLSQLDDDVVVEPLAFASQKLSGCQHSWSTIEREAYAIFWALNRFRKLVYGTRVLCEYNRV